MHKLIEYICDELEELERKADKEGKLSMAEIQYGDTLAHFKKNLLKSEEMMDESEYSMAVGGGRGSRRSSYARGGMRGGRNSYARRDAMGRYSREDGYSMDGGEMIDELHELMNEAPNEQTRMEFRKFIQKIEQMQ